MIARDVVTRWLVSAMLVLTVIGCTSSQPSVEPPPGAPPPSNQAGPLPADCPSKITDADRASTALAQVQPGGVVCLSGDGLAAAELSVTTSGTAAAPIMILADGAAMRGVSVKADYVIVAGLALRDGSGLKMAGRGLVARNNVIYNATKDGLACTGCTDTIIESNTVQRADGTGIYIEGERVTVRNNTV
ncbi:MAG TPA: right-handed parallel beta-helix repeat-containing protein, partial [Pseudonocardiaceae bacterium]